MEAASFTLSLLKVILMLQKRQFAPISSHFKEATPKVSFEAQKLRVLTETEPFPKVDRPVIIGINSFGFGGANGHCLVEEYVMPDESEWSRLPEEIDNKMYMVPFSAKSEDALIENARRLAVRVGELEGEVDMYTLVGNLSTRMTHHRVRTSIQASSIMDLKEKLTAFVERADLNELKQDETARIQLPRGNDEKANEKGNILMIFPGQGSQWAGCGQELYNTEIVFRRVVDTIDWEWIKYTGSRLSDVAFDKEAGDKLNDCFWAQPVTFMIQVALFEMLKSSGIHPKAVIGHSAGEATAAYASGMYSLEEACYLVYHRSRLQNTLAGCGRMLVLMNDSTSVLEILKEYEMNECLDIACFNSPCNTVICGAEQEINKLREKLENDGRQTGTLIAGNIAFHSRYMDPIKIDLFDSLQALDCQGNRRHKIPMISSVTGDVITSIDTNYWWSNVREPVNLLAAIETAKINVKPEVIIEISPHITLRSPIRDYYDLNKESFPNYIFTLIRKSNTAEMFAQALGNCFKAGLPLKFDKLFPRPRPITNLLPAYSMKRERVIDINLDERHFRKAENFCGGPLLGTKVLNDHPHYVGIMSKQHFSWMCDHVVQGQPLVPGAAYNEMLFQCFKGKPVHVINARILHPCVIGTDPEYLSSELTPIPQSPNRYEAKIYSRKHDFDTYDCKIHCLGTIEEISEESISDLLPSWLPMNLKDDDGNYSECRYATGKDFYTTMSARIGHSFSYGPYFQTVARVDSDLIKRRDRLEVAIDTELWKKWDTMGYLFHPSMLDGALQSFLIYVMEASDFSGIPQMINNLVFIKKSTSERVIVIYRPPEYIRNNFHRKGQLAFGLGERSAGCCSVYDSLTGDLLMHLGDYTANHADSKKADMRRLKHRLSWQPKDGSHIHKNIPSLISLFDNGVEFNDVAKQILTEILKNGHPLTSENLFLNAGEYILGGVPEKLVLETCLSSITNAPVQYSLLSSDTSLLSDAFQKFGTTNQDAHLRFLEMKATEDSTKDILRPAMFELLIIRARKVLPNEGDSSSNAEGESQHTDDTLKSLTLDEVASLLVPGGLILVENFGQSIDYPSDWTCSWKSSDSGITFQIFVAPSLSHISLPEIEYNHDESIVISDTLGFSNYWSSFVLRSSPSQELDFEKAKGWRRIDYFAMSNHDLSSENCTLYDGPANLVDFVKELYVYRNGVEGLVPCILTVFTSGAMLNVKDPCQTGIWGAVRSLALEISDSCKLEFRLLDVSTHEDLNFALACEKMRERELCIHNGKIWTSRLINDRVPLAITHLAADDDCAFHLHTDYSGLIGDLEFRAEVLSPLQENEIEVAVKASALNFRDVMVGLGRLPMLSYEASALGRTVGMECSGVVVRCGSAVTSHKVGDKIVAMKGGCIANRIRCHEKVAYKMPDNLTYEEGSSLASVYITAYYALIYLARMREGQSVLVHSALGGVGQAAIALAKLKGAKVYGTAGSNEKRDALRELGCIDAFDSHSTRWYSDLMKATNGRGVDIVLNSLAGEHVDLCLEALAPGGWHCEIGKMDIFANRPIKLAVFRKNIAYRAIDVDRLMTDDPYLVGELMKEIMILIQNKEVPALPLATYSYKDYHEALRFMMNGQHRGKIVLTPPNDNEKLPVIDCRPIFASSDEACNRTIILSGCLGGFGLRVLAYIVALGARHIVLLDRDSKRERSVEWVLEKSYISYLQGSVHNLRVEIVYCDVAKYQDVVNAVSLVERLGMPPIGSVFHLAGVLDDKNVSDIDRNSFAKVYEPKANGAWNLHKATLHLETLEHFVMFSSTSSVFGNPGQTNYSAANSFQDGLAAMRMANGKPALSFCMGAVIETGMASRNPQLLQLMKAGGMPAISCIFAIEALDSALKTGKTQWNTVAAVADDFRTSLGSSDFLRVPAQLIRNNAAFKVGGGAVLSKEALVEILSTRVGALCGVEKLDPTEPFSSYGLNSISVAELVAYLKNEMSYSVSAMELMTSATCESIADGILKAQEGDSDDSNQNETIVTETNDSELCENSELALKQKEVNEIWSKPLVEECSLYEPSIDEFFVREHRTVTKPLKSLFYPTIVREAPLFDTELSTSVVTKSPLDFLTKIDGRLPKPVQDTFDDLRSYSDSLDTTTVEEAVPVHAIRRVLLTGATGFVGRHLIADLLQYDGADINLIYCPVRAKDDQSALDRVVEAMKESETWDDSYFSRLRVFKGDLTEENFGTTASLFQQMVHSVDAIYHLAANLNLTSSFDELRDSNCYPLKGVLRMCLSVRKKHLFLASTLGIFPQYFCQFSNEMAVKPITRDAMPDIDLMKRVFPLVIGGYQWTKFVVELVCMFASKQKNLPLAVFRLPAMFTNSQSGYSFAGDPTVNLLFASLEMRQAPVQERPLLIEDSAVQNEMMVRISLNPSRRNVIYHCSSTSQPIISEASTYAMMGYSCATTSYEAFKARCLKKGPALQLNTYWLLLDHMAPWWIKYKRLNLEFPIDSSTVREDCYPVPARSNALKCFSKSMEWALRHKELSPFNLELLRPSTDFDTIILPARRLCSEYDLDFDSVVPHYVREGLHRICNELKAPMHRLPEVCMFLTSRLESRVHLYRLLTMHPEILDEPIIAPMFILGMNRTGTTLMHRMIEASGHFDAPHIEELGMLPKAEYLVNPDPIFNEKRLEFMKSMIIGYVTSAEGIHEIETGVADEDMCAHSTTFMSLEYDVLYDLPLYREWLEAQDLAPVYEEHRQWMQFIAWSRRRTDPNYTGRWCFKMPFHLRSLQQLINTYPDACFVHTHRELIHVAGSWCSLVERQRERFVENIDRLQLGRDQVHFITNTLSSGVEFRKNHPELEHRWMDVDFNDVVSEPVTMAIKALSHAGAHVSTDTVHRLQVFVQDSMEKHKNTKLHTYDMRDYGITILDLESKALDIYRNEFQSRSRLLAQKLEQIPVMDDFYDIGKEEKVAN